jgi:hypothetical protein
MVPVRSGGCSGALGPDANGGRTGAGLPRSGSSVTAEVEPFSDGGAAGASAVGAAGCAGAALAAITGASGSGASTGCCSSIFSGSSTAVAAPLPDGWAMISPWTRLRTSSATGSSIELECVFFSVTPTSGNISTITCDGISSCLASSLIRILLIFKTATLS